MSATSFQECPVCGGPVTITDEGLVYCPAYDPQGRWPARDATREHWGFLMGLANHGAGVARHDNAFPAGTEAARCWLAGWDEAERAEIRESHREKLVAELGHG